MMEKKHSTRQTTRTGGRDIPPTRTEGPGHPADGRPGSALPAGAPRCHRPAPPLRRLRLVRYGRGRAGGSRPAGICEMVRPIVGRRQAAHGSVHRSRRGTLAGGNTAGRWTVTPPRMAGGVVHHEQPHGEAYRHDDRDGNECAAGSVHGLCPFLAAEARGWHHGEWMPGRGSPGAVLTCPGWCRVATSGRRAGVEGVQAGLVSS